MIMSTVTLLSTATRPMSQRSVTQLLTTISVFVAQPKDWPQVQED